MLSCSMSGATRLTQHQLKMTPIFEAVPIPFVHQFVTGGEFQPNDGMTAGVAAMLGELLRVTEALRPLRSSSPE
jgi:hypothetical protein